MSVDAGIRMVEAGLHEMRAEREMSKSRLARLMAADALEKVGKTDEAARLVAEVKREQEES